MAAFLWEEKENHRTKISLSEMRAFIEEKRTFLKTISNQLEATRNDILSVQKLLKSVCPSDKQKSHDMFEAYDNSAFEFSPSIVLRLAVKNKRRYSE